MSVAFTESIVEVASLAWLQALDYAVLHGPDIAAGEPGAERSDPSYRDGLLESRLRQTLVRLNPDLPPEALDDAWRKLTHVDAPSLVERNRAVHRMLVDGVTVEYRRKDGSIAGAQARVIDFDAPTSTVALRPGAVVVTFALSATSAPEAPGKTPRENAGENAGGNAGENARGHSEYVAGRSGIVDSRTGRTAAQVLQRR